MEYLSSCICVGFEYEYEYEYDYHFSYHDDEDPNASDPHETYTKLCTYHAELTGLADQIELKVYGDDTCDECVFYKCIDANNSYSTIYLHRQHTGVKHVYTNMVAVEGDWNFNGSYGNSSDGAEVEPKVHVMSFRRQGRIGETSGQSLVMSGYERNNDYGVNIDVGLQSGFENVKTILLYIDSFLAIFQATLPGDFTPWKEYDDNTGELLDSYNVNYSIIKRSNQSYNNGWDDSIFMGKPRANGMQKCIYHSYWDYARNKDVNLENIPLDNRLQFTIDDPTENIPYAHRWICNCKLPGMDDEAKISGWYNIVVPIKTRNNREIGYIARCKSKFHRFTKYWAVYDNVDWTPGLDMNSLGSSEGEGLSVCKQSDKIPTKNICNKLILPIFKPWAAVELVVWCDSNEGKGAFGGPNPADEGYPDNATYKLLHKRTLDEYADKYCTRVLVSANNQLRDDKSFDQYCRIDSPFRVEYFLCHGARQEYNDIDNKSDVSYFCVAENSYQWWVRDNIDKLHYNIYKYNTYPSSLKTCFLSQCCFGQGIAGGSRRSPLKHLVKTPNEAIGRDSMVMFGASATHTGNGVSYRNKINEDAPEEDESNWRVTLGVESTFHILSRVCFNLDTDEEKEMVSYKDVATQFNNTVAACKLKSFAKIKEFYINNFDLMLEFLPSDAFRKSWTTVKPYILQDIENNGIKYFCRDEKEDDEDEANYIDNYIEPERFGKMYRIYNSFIGFILHDINDKVLAKVYRKESWPTRRRIVSECDAFLQ